MAARIYKPARTAMQSGPARTKEWVLEYDPAAPREIDPLMGWTSSRDMLSQVQLNFATKEEAIAYAERNGTGRDHNPGGFTMWLAGGGTRPGFAFGATDEFGHHAVENKVHMHDLHATMLHLLGLDHLRLTFRYAGRNFRLTDVAGRVVQEIVA